MKNIFRFLFIMFCLITTTNLLRAQWIQTTRDKLDLSLVVEASALVVSSNEAGGKNLFAFSEEKVFVSTNYGLTWKLSMNGLTSTGFRALAVSGTNIFAGTTPWPPFSPGGVFRTTNNGLSWSEMNNGLTNRFIRTFAVSGNNLYAGGDYDGVFLSTNNGLNWSAIGLKDVSVRDLEISGSNIFAGTKSGVFFSTNNGTSWTAVNTGLTSINVYALAVSGTNIFAGTDSYGVFRSSNNGANWISVNNGLPNGPIDYFVVSGTNIFAGISPSIFLSTNNGTSWTFAGAGAILATTTNMKGGEDLFANLALEGFAVSTNNGLTWTTTPVKDNRVNVLAVSGTNLFAGNLDGNVFRYTDSEGTWSWGSRVLANDEIYDLAVSQNGTSINLFACTKNGVFLSTDNGITWSAVNSGLTQTSISSLAISGTNIFATGLGVFRSTNNGTNWTYLGLKDSYYPNKIAVSGSNLFVASSLGSGVLHSSDNGTNWKSIGLSGNMINVLEVSDTSLFAGTDDVNISTNNGTSWSVVNIGSPILSFAFSGNNIFAGTEGNGVYLSTNNGLTWTAVGLGPSAIIGEQNGIVRSLAVYGTNLFAGTWKRPLNEMITSMENNSEDLPTQFSLNQNYPNPFNPSTTIKFSLPKTAYVSLRIYNSLGQEIAQIVSQEMSAGNYTTEWNASGFTSGVYFYRIQAGSFTETKKLVLLR